MTKILSQTDLVIFIHCKLSKSGLSAMISLHYCNPACHLVPLLPAITVKSSTCYSGHEHTPLHNLIHKEVIELYYGGKKNLVPLV